MKIGLMASLGDTVAVVCSDPAAADGVFYLKPPYINVPHMKADFDYVLIDTKKLIQDIKTKNTSLYQHLIYKGRGEVPSGWLEYITANDPRETSHWNYYDNRLVMVSGHADLVRMIELLELPCFPITVDKGTGALVDRLFGFKDHTQLRPVRPRKMPWEDCDADDFSL